MRAELIGTTKPANILLGELPVLIGRAADSDVHLGDPAEGDYHCLINWIDSDLIVRDLGAGSGTYVNGIRITKTRLRSGDTLRVGTTEFSVKCDSRPRRYLFGVRN